MKPPTTSDPLEPTLREWFSETGKHSVPPYLDETLARIDRTGQRRDWLVRLGIVPIALPALRGTGRLVLAVGLLLALLVLGLLAFGGSRTPTLPPELGARMPVVFDTDGDIYVAAVDGSGRLAITASTSYEFGAVWSPAGDRVAYWSAPAPDGRQASLWLVDPDGRDAAQVSASIVVDVDPMFPAATFSPDGRRLAFATVDGHLWVVDIDGTGLRELGGPGLRRYDPAWSPSGDLIAYFGEGDTGVYVIDPDGTTETKVSSGTSVPVSLRLPSWSPDGRRLTYHVQTSDDDSDIAIATLGTTGWTQAIVIGGDTSDAWPRFSPDGRQLVFVRSGAGSPEGTAWIADADGRTLRQVGADLLGWAPVCLSPDRNHVLGAAGEAGVPLGSEVRPRVLVLHLGRDSPTSVIDVPGRRSYAACSWQRDAP